MPFRPSLPCRCPFDRKLTSFLSAVASLADSRSRSPFPPAGAVPATLTPTAYNALMSAYSRAGRHDEVLRLFFSLPFAPTAPLFTTLISSLAASGSKSAALDAFSLLASGIGPTTSAFTALLKSIDAASSESVYRAFFATMAAMECAPDAATYNCLIWILCDSQRLDEAWGVLDSMLEVGVCPTVRSYTAILHGYCKQGRVLEAERLLDTMIQVGCAPDVISYSVLIQGLCRVGEFGKVERILGESEAKGWTPNAVTYNIYMSALCRMGFLDEAFRQVDVMHSRGVYMTIETVNILFDCLCRGSMFSEALTLLECSEELNWDVDVFCYNTMMSRLCDTGDIARVLKLLVDLVKKGIGPDMFSFTIAIRSLCRAGKFKVAKCLLDNKGIEYDVVAFNTLIHGLCMAGELHEMLQTYMDMTSRNVFPNNFTIGMVIDSFCKNREFGAAIKVFLEYSEGCLVPDHFFRLNTWLVKAKGWEYLLTLLRTMRSKGLVLDVCLFNSLVRMFCCEGYCNRETFCEVSLILDSMLECLSSTQHKSASGVTV
ncbi:pentatricopeptide repeat-containing protein At1g63400 [Zea mays]|uniref:Pentatricopeptide repeat-containing protein n=2 Tax=Zea mays TaxID=4577 RepID=A0A804LG60_MAIZE|nr:pentatricopeptide repeat-containing protein At1g63400 [Zea mays]XP_035818956.1 pentatricopeptide repeat-containing protein At1g63400 [Zea mays]|eukprot:XP_020401169.1 pentatricopeptide repeat-containing protein At1g63400 [Zea mays]